MNVSARHRRTPEEYGSAELHPALRDDAFAHSRRDTTSTKLRGEVPSVRLRHRPDIDGLRAVAVVSVILFHAYPKLAPGGFVGVDAFFVISGFLITSLILNDLNEKRFQRGRFLRASN